MDKLYSETLKKLYKVNKFLGIKLDLTNMIEISKLENNPHLNIPYVHIAGTNGKGSVALKLAKIFENSGFKTGLYTSPHLFTFRERIQINGEYIEKSYLVDYLNNLFKKCENNNLNLTYFEYVTMLAFNYFLDKKVDIAVLETGLGGRLDATNIVDPLLSIITSIGLDHCDSLGKTIDLIAVEKAGIIKKNKPVVIGPFANPKSVFENIAKSKNSQLYQCELPVSNSYDFNSENNSIVKYSIDVLKLKYPQFLKIDNVSIEKGCKSTQLCRNQSLSSEIIQKLPYKNKPKAIIFDVGHNPDALYKLLFSLFYQYPNTKKRIIYGTSSKKDCFSSIEILCKFADKIHFVQGKHPRAMPISVLSENVEKFNQNNISNKDIFEKIVDDANISKTIHLALNNINSNDEEILVICGSFFIMKEVFEFFKLEIELDEVEMNEL